MDTSSRHILVEYRGCDSDLLGDRERLETLMRRAATAAGATVVGAVFHRYSPQGISGVVVIEESHFSLHTWPEVGYAALDFFTCGDCHPERAHEVMVRELGATAAELMAIDRGQGPPGRSMHLQRHETLVVPGDET